MSKYTTITTINIINSLQQHIFSLSMFLSADIPLNSAENQAKRIEINKNLSIKVLKVRRHINHFILNYEEILLQLGSSRLLYFIKPNKKTKLGEGFVIKSVIQH